MKLSGKSLVEVAALVVKHLRTYGIDLVIVGGSAITAHVPTVYTSMDIDFAATSGSDRRTFTRALSELGFREQGRIFAHDDTAYTIDFVSGTPHIDREPIDEYAEVSTSVGSVRVLRLEDAIADRVAAFLHWSDSEALDVAERSMSAARHRLTWGLVDAALMKLDTRTSETKQRMALARERLQRACGRI